MFGQYRIGEKELLDGPNEFDGPCSCYEVWVYNDKNESMNLVIWSLYEPTVEDIELHILSCVTVLKNYDRVTQLFQSEKTEIEIYEEEEYAYGEYLSKFFSKKFIKELVKKYDW